MIDKVLVTIMVTLVIQQLCNLGVLDEHTARAVMQWLQTVLGSIQGGAVWLLT